MIISYFITIFRDKIRPKLNWSIKENFKHFSGAVGLKMSSEKKYKKPVNSVFHSQSSRWIMYTCECVFFFANFIGHFYLFFLILRLLKSFFFYKKCYDARDNLKIFWTRQLHQN